MSHPPAAAPSGVDGAARPWHCSSTDDVLRRLGSSEAGLTQAEAAQRLTDHGPNRLVDARPVRPLTILLQQFKSFIIWILIAAGALSALLGEHLDASAILAIVVLNALIGFYQEYNAEKSVARLKRLTAPTATVRRGGEAGTSPASDIVVGDVLVLQAGDLVAADARLLSAAALTCVEAALTGESKAVAKQPAPFSKPELPLGDRANMVYVGTSVATGAGTAVVVATGMETELGHIAGMIAEAGAEEETPLQRRLDAFGRVLLWATLGIVALLFVLGLWRGTPLLELVLTAVSLAVAAIPEGLPAVVTVALSLGVMRMARRRTLVRKLAAVETLGSTSVICTDKTGTLTVGEMTAQRIWIDGTVFTITGQGYTPTGSILHEDHAVTEAQQVLLSELAGVLVGGNHARLREEDGAWSVIGDPTEGALLVAGTKAGADQSRMEKDMPRRAAFPFDSERKRSSLVRQDANGGLQLFVNGAPGPLLERCTRYRSLRGIRPLTAGDREKILKETSALAKSSLRVLASATRTLEGPLPADPASDTVENDLVFVGLTGMYDPPRPEAKATMVACQAAGIRIVMITGDHAETARAVAREIGLAAPGDLAVSGIELDRISDQDLSRKAAKIAVYARVTAAHKLRIVRALRANGEVVAMTGDGINDAPALKGADIGIAMGRSGTEVTKQAADMIITDDNFSTLLVAIEEGRGIYDNIRKTLQFLLSGSAGELLLMAACVIGGLPTPLLPIHLLWINLVTDGLPALCLATDDIDRDVMKRAPRPPGERLTNFAFVRTLIVTGLLTAGVAFAVYVYALQVSTPAVARTAAFTVMVFAELLRAFGARSATKPLWRITPGLSVRLLVVVSVSIGLQFWSQQSAVFGRFLKTSPLSVSQFLLLLLIGAIPLVVIEVSKVLRRTDRPHRPRRGEATRDTPNKDKTAVPAGVRSSRAAGFIASQFVFPRVGQWSLLGLTLLTTVSCSTPSSRERLDNLVPVPTQWRQPGAFPPSPLSASSVTWWASFNDPMLTELVNVALASNRDLHAAFARIEEYQARQGLQRAGLFPSVDGGVSTGQTRTSIRNAASDSTRDVAAASLDASWQIDLFGRQRKQVAAATAELFLTFEDHYGMQVSLAAAVASAYITLRQAEAQLVLVELGLKTRQETAQLTLWREQAGTGSALDSRQALTSLELARASLPSLRLTLAQSRTQLTQLCSLTPGSLESRLSKPSAVPVPEGSVAVAIPAEILRQRPDVRGAELALQAAYARTDATRRLRLPSLALSGSLGVEALQVDRLFNPTTTILNLFAGLSAPLFDAGRIRHSITIQEQLEIQTLDAYAAITLNALGEVEDALASVLQGVDRMSILERAVAAARETSDLATLQFEAGQVDLFIDLDAQRTLLDLEQQQVAAAAGHAQAHVQLYLALGGGWTRLAGDRRSLP